MKKKNKPHYLMMALIVAVVTAATWSCNKDDDPSLADLREDKLQYLEDSLRISDSLKRLNAAGVVNYAISVVNGSTSTLFSNAANPGREKKTKNTLDGAIVTISQYGKTMTDTTDESGMVVFTGFFRTTVNVTVRKEAFTTVAYAAAVNLNTATTNNTISFIGNLIPVFETTGANSATISGRATIETDLTNKTREVVPDGTQVTASIDAKDATFAAKFLTTGIDNFYDPASTTCGCQILDMGEILQASYQTGVAGVVTGGSYTITIPAAIDGLPIALSYSELAADQTAFETGANGQRTITNRVIFNDNSVTGPLATLPASSNVTISFSSGTGAAATAIVSENAGTLDRINLTADGSGYIQATPPLVEITGGGGSGAIATATVGANGRITGIALTNPGTGYTSAPTVTIVAGTGATASAGLAGNGTVTTVVVTNSGSGYTTAPAVTFPAPGGTGTTAQGTSNIDASGRVVSITITDAGSGYSADPGVITIGAPPAGGVQAQANALYSGQSVSNVTVTGGSNYTYAPRVIFTPNGANGQRPNGTPATGVASFDPVTRQVTGIQITSPGSGYLLPPVVTLDAGSGATATAFLTGGSVTNANITAQGSLYAYPPTVVIGSVTSGGGLGASGTAILQDGKVIGIEITNGGSGYTSAPDILLVTGDHANAYATVLNGAISTITVTDGGRNFAGAPRVGITSIDGGGATATATVENGQITGVTVTAGGSGYLDGNDPGTAERFSATKGSNIVVKPGISYVNDIHYGTGAIRQPN